MTVEAVVFDIGNVMIEWAPERFYDGLFGEKRRREIFASVDLSGMNERVDLGAPFRQTVYAFAEENPRFRDEIRLWHDRWIDMASPAIPRSVHLLRALRAKGVPVFALSNFGRESFELACTAYDFLTEFDRTYVSAHYRMIKPDPSFYAMLETDSGLSGASLLFADDRSDNIAAACARGWHTHLFEGPEGWARSLVAHGLLTEEETRP
ncbi:MAG: haloacid dehalogenase [Rhodobacteraceae bacterium CG17_big_fil_post_rev_8_21_14_2_50_65_11]|nr:MAG: haloacid dehalogenase [Rhodobacteraceae bacterium CG17_big_fil_post_rev_8_21_14_2_50_65_11]